MRPSPALVISIIALITAMGGVSYAAFALPKNSVGSKQLKANAVTTKKIKNGAVTAAKLNTTGVTVPNALHATSASSASSASNASALGGFPASAFQGRVRWAEVEADGTIDAQSGGIAVTLNSTGEYYVNFGAPVAGHAVSATIQWRSGVGLSTGAILVAPCGSGTGTVFCVVSNNNNTLYVQTMDNTNTTEANRAFFAVLYP